MTATTKFESSTISLPRPVPAHGGRDPEEGEISDGVEEGEEVFSDISDEELESNYGRNRIKRGDKGEMESKSLAKNGENDLPDDYEDVDEDILYLRLMALRSMIPPSDMPSATANKSPVSSKSIEDEMKELLEEADKAAAQSSIPPPPIIDIADSDEEKMDLYMKTMTTNMSFLAPISTKVKEEDVQEEQFGEPNLEYLVMKLKHSLENGENVQQEEGGSVYSPTQSPVQLSPPSSPNVIPLPPEGVLKPPGDDEYVASKTVCSGAHQPVDMELGSENEAEIQFFKHQKEIPSDPWPQQQAQIIVPSPLTTSSALTHPQMLYNCDHYLYQERMYQERSPDAKKNDLLKAVTAKPPPPPPPPMPSSLPPLTNSVLTKNKKRMRKRKSTTTIKCINSSDEEESGMAGARSKKRATPPPAPPPPATPLEPIDSEDEEAMRAHLLSTMAAKRDAKNRKKEVGPPTTTEILKTKSEKPVLKKSSAKVAKKKPTKLSSDISGLTTDIPFDKLKKYFPNMVRPFIIPLNIPTSSEDESTSINSFQANLDLLMKNAREGSVSLPKAKRVPPPKPVRKNPPRSKGSTALLLTNKATHPIRKRYISLVEKESLKTRSSIEHLPIERQKEYKMLLARIAVKEKKQQIESKKEAAEDPEEMRRLLLSKMKNLKSKIDQNKTDLKKKVLIESKENSEPKNREETSPPLPLVVNERVMASEKEVISSRNDVVNGLFKLSAQLSQFRSESEKLITAQNFLSDLLKQVEETRKLIKKKEERITQLRHVVKLSHLSISKKRKDLSGRESKCKKLGEKLIGNSYELPETGTDQIKQKLVQIASNAKLCKKVNRDSASCNNSTEEDGPKRSELSGVSSSIAHLRPGGVEHSIDPHREFCRFELLGKCNDDACPYQHHKSVS